jgi:hypothetical protein
MFFPLEFFYVLLGKPYLWKFHVVYDSMPHSVIITLNMKLYRIPKVVPPSSIYLISSKQCIKNISHTKKFFFFVIRSQSEKNVSATSMSSTDDLNMQQKQVDKVVEDYKDIFSSPTRVPMYCQVKHSIGMTPHVLLPNGPVYTSLR